MLNTKDELEIGLNVFVASLLGAGEKAIVKHLKKRGLTDETIEKAKEVSGQIVKEIFEGLGNDESK